MEDNDHLRSSRGDSALGLQQGDSAFQSHDSPDHGLEEATARDAEPIIKAAMEETSQDPVGHRLAVLPSRAYSSVAVIDVAKLTTSNQQLVLSRAMETEGQDNERLLTQIRERQDRCVHWCWKQALPVHALQRASSAFKCIHDVGNQQLLPISTALKQLLGLQCRSGAV